METEHSENLENQDEVEISRLDQFVEALGKSVEDSKVAVFIGSPDPDSIGSGVGMQALVRLLTGELADLIYTGEIDHKQNTHALNALDIALIPLSKILNGGSDNLLSKCYRRVIFVDCFPRDETENVEGPIIFDHHDHTDDSWLYSDVRQCGAVCSIIWEYLDAAGYAFNNDQDHGIIVATALDFGIQNDSKELTSKDTGDLDIKAHTSLLPHVDRIKLSSIRRYSKPRYHIDYLRATMEECNHIIKGSFYVGCAGMLSSKQRSEIPTLADFWVELEGIDTAVVFGIVDKTKLVMSVRSFDTGVNADVLCKSVFGAGGAKKGAGTATVDMGPFAITTGSEEDQKRALESTRCLIMDKVVKYLSDA